MIDQVKNTEFFAKGKRGIIYKGTLNKQDVIIKKKNPDSRALFRIENEIKILKIVNKHDIGPRLLSPGSDYLIYRFVKGLFIVDFMHQNSREKITSILKDIFQQMRTLDKLKINKFEMHNPIKHIIIDKKPVLIDFERGKISLTPKNTTQFCQFLLSSKVQAILKKKNISIDIEKLKQLSKSYKKNPTDVNFKKIMGMLK